MSSQHTITMLDSVEHATPHTLPLSIPPHSTASITPIELNSKVDIEMHPASFQEQVLSSCDAPPNPTQAGGSEGPSQTTPTQISEQIQSIWEPYKNRYRVLAACGTSFANGMNDAAAGALIASLEK